ncbi:LacI family DNA-binding transcriptional regulator [Jeotgalibaca sp. MA1X17-3]|nr:LacI family DNA-binding transcriptional regulator [Jeotgalibaca sp. MA1X17-3]
MITITDIANKAGVAKSTVSRYLNGGSVSPKTKMKIEKIIKETGYKPNPFAQSLKARRTNLIGTIIPRLDSYSTNEALTAIDEELRKKNRQHMITNSNQDPLIEVENIYTLAKQKVDGILLFAGAITDAHRVAFQKIDIPIVVLGQSVDGRACIIHNDEQAGYEMGSYIRELGHERILLLTVTEADIAIGQRRKKGIIRALQENSNCTWTSHETSFVFDEAYEDCKKIIQKTDATAIICLTDTIALAAMKAIHELGLKIPNDFSLSGFGGYAAGQIVTPPITTVHYPYKKLGKLAVQTLLQSMDGGEVPELQVLSNSLHIQESTSGYHQQLDA